MDKFEKLKNKLGKNSRSNEPMAKHTTLKIGGPAKLFVKATSEKDLEKFVKAAKDLGIPYLVIGEGSNLLVHEKGFDGLVIKNMTRGIGVDGNRVRVKAGTELQELVDYLVKHGFSGMQKMTGIPGTVGGAIYGNAGAYGQTISDHLIRVRVFDGKKIRWIPKRRCGFSYRDSAFKRLNYVILEAEFKLERDLPEKLAKEARETLKMRLKKYPPNIRTPGSFYKNILAADLSEEQLARIPPEKIVYKKVPAGYLLEAVGAKGAQLGNIKIADYHANLFINLNGGKASDFYKLAAKYAKEVEKKFGIKLEPEVQLIGFGRPK